MKRKALRRIPSVEQVVQAVGKSELPRPVIVRLVREHLSKLRRTAAVPDGEELFATIRETVTARERTRIQPVINGTGVILHTNLGRSILSGGAIERINAIASQYSNLELDLTTGHRGVRAHHLEECLAAVCSAESATLVNNCAAALMLILRRFIDAERNEVVISRGELVQIGGGFRIPEILEASGARLREVGTTNQTTGSDFKKAVGNRTALILKVHRSNFSMSGFVDSADTRELSLIARQARVPLVEDLGSGALFDTAKISGAAHEPTPSEAIRCGVDLVCFSGDKLSGGPQAGVIAGRRKWIAALKREPFFRAVRCDKLVLAAMEATVEAYLAGTAEKTIPTLALAVSSVESLRERGTALLSALKAPSIDSKLRESAAELGGGTLPGASIPSIALELHPKGTTAHAFVRALRLGRPPVIACLANGRVRIDLRTVLPHQDRDLIRAIEKVAAELRSN